MKRLFGLRLPKLVHSLQQPLLCLLQIFRITYCKFFNPAQDEVECRETCREFVDLVMQHFPEMMKKPKIHLMLHIVDSMKLFGPTSAYNTERLVYFKYWFVSYNLQNRIVQRSNEDSKYFWQQTGSKP